MKTLHYYFHLPIYTVLFFSLLNCRGPELGSNEHASTEISGPMRNEMLGKTVYEWTHEEKVLGFRNIAHLWNTREIEAGPNPSVLPQQEHTDLLSLAFEFKDSTYTFDKFIAHNQPFGLLVIKNGEVVLERYAQGNTPQSKWISFSVAKSVVSLLVGAAVKDGLITNLDAPITTYLPELAGSAYEDVSFWHTMQMASGVKWDENYNDPESDIRQFVPIQGTAGMLEYVKKLPRVAPPGERFNYNTAETRLVGMALRSAIGEDLSAYLSRKIWVPFGMESDANWWLLSRGGTESGGCCISATLRDYGRIGLFTLNELKGSPFYQRVLPEDWIAETTAPSKGADYYGALWWPDYGLDGNRTFAAYGIFGQMIWVDPTENLVVVTHSAWPEALGKEGENYHAINAAFAIAVAKILRE
ncbi:MAG: serine hydrolase [Bacteroidota bacterium]